MTLTIDTIALLASASPSRTRVTNPDARALAMRTRDADKAAALQAAQDAALAFHDYTPAQRKRIETLRSVYWPRARAVRDALAVCDAKLTRHNDTHDEYTLSVSEREDVIIRGIRLATLLARTYAATATYGRFPISRADMRTDKRTRFLGSAAARHFTFNGGRDWGSAEFDPSDIVQGAFIRAIDNDDTVHGVPTFGSMFRWIQVERAHLTRMANAEFSARKSAALGHVEKAVDEWPEMTDKHAMRLLGTRRYPTLDQHRESLAIAHRDAQMIELDDTVATSAREDALDGASEREFHVIVARVLMAGSTLSEVAQALGLKPETVAADCIRSREKSLRHIATGIDHSERSIDIHNAAERERAIDAEEQEHAERLRSIELIRHTVTYAAKHAA